MRKRMTPKQRTFMMRHNLMRHNLYSGEIPFFNTMPVVINDGGRAASGRRGAGGDCVTRAIAIALEKPYDEVFNALKILALGERITKRRRRRSSVANGVHKATWKRYLKAQGWEWVPTMQIGQGTKVHLRRGELPNGRLIVSVSKHLVAVIDGVIHDTGDPSHDGTRCVYGYHKRP